MVVYKVFSKWKNNSIDRVMVEGKGKFVFGIYMCFGDNKGLCFYERRGLM